LKIERWKSWINYFRVPFPSREGFAPYRFPGIAVHIPILVAFVLVGFHLNREQMAMVPSLVIYPVAGFYWGRDLAIYAHYNVLILLFVGIFFLAYGPWLIPMFTALQASPSFPMVSWISDATVLLGFLAYVSRRARSWF
jgi:hypothetical protein